MSTSRDVDIAQDKFSAGNVAVSVDPGWPLGGSRAARRGMPTSGSEATLNTDAVSLLADGWLPRAPVAPAGPAGSGRCGGLLEGARAGAQPRRLSAAPPRPAPPGGQRGHASSRESITHSDCETLPFPY